MPFRKATLAALAVALLAAPSAHAGATPPYFDVAKLPEPPVSGKEIADNIADFTTTYAHRVTGSLAEMQAATFLRDELAAEGYQASIVDVPQQPGAPSAITHVVIGQKKGTTHPDEEIVFTAHFDQVPQTINGSYDNGSGTNMVRALAKSLAKVPTNRTLTFTFYNGEEEGTLSSGPLASQYKAENRKVAAVLGFDMVGIAYPVANPGAINCLCMWRGEEDEAFDGLQSHVAFDVLGLPNKENLVEVRGPNDRNSDENSWDAYGYPTMRWAGLKTAADYPQYHLPGDTMDEIDTVAGGRSFFEQGLRNTLLTAYDTALSVDNSPPTAKAAASGAGPQVSFDAAGSSDPDGAPSEYTWRFGDGATATGAHVTHTYAKAGDYTATLTVGDNLWPQVISGSDVAVHVTKGAAKPAAKKHKKKHRKHKKHRRHR